MNGTRIDKWLWAARFFKTRALAAKACELGRVRSNHVIVKAAREVRAGDHLHITTAGGDFGVDVLALSEVRGPASVAQTLYRETAESREARAKIAAERKVLAEWEVLPASKPNKRDRRTLSKYRGKIIPF